MTFFVYMLASQRNGTLYVGMTDDLAGRVSQHKEKITPGFTSRYGVDRLVWWEPHATRESAFVRERRIKGWRRAWKIELIERSNPGWRDLYLDWFQDPNTIEADLAAAVRAELERTARSAAEPSQTPLIPAKAGT